MVPLSLPCLQICAAAGFSFFPRSSPVFLSPIRISSPKKFFHRQQERHQFFLFNSQISGSQYRRSQIWCSGGTLVCPSDLWGMWTVLFAAAALGLWSEKKTRLGSTMSAAVVSTLAGLAASSLRMIPAEAAPAYAVVMDYLLPLAVPLLLFNADLRRILKSTGTLLLAFLLGSVSTIVGTVIAYLLVPMRSLGADSWKIAAALMSSYIGGSVNYVAVSKALGISPSIMAAGVATDNIMCAIYFMVIFALASNISAEASSSSQKGMT